VAWGWVFFVPHFSYSEERGIVAKAGYDGRQAGLSWSCKKFVKFRMNVILRDKNEGVPKVEVASRFGVGMFDEHSSTF
jgi:hypothetical protein